MKALNTNSRRGVDPARGSEARAGDPAELERLRAEVSELRRQIGVLDEQLATTRRDRDAFAGQASERERTIQDLRVELEQRGPR